MDCNEEEPSAITVIAQNSIFASSDRALRDENIHEDMYFYLWSKAELYTESHKTNRALNPH